MRKRKQIKRRCVCGCGREANAKGSLSRRCYDRIERGVSLDAELHRYTFPRGVVPVPVPGWGTR